MNNESTLSKFHFNTEFHRVINLLNISCSLENGPWISGGTARRLWFNTPWLNYDIDLFFQDPESLNKICSRLDQLNAGQKCEQPHVTRNAATYKIKIDPEREIRVQTISRDFYKNYQEIWKSFDFTSCCFVTDGYQIIADSQAVEDCKNQILRKVKDSTRGLDGRRVVKYGIYGFKPTKQILKELLEQKETQTITTNWASEDDYT